VAAKLGVCRATVYKLTATRQLDHLRVGAQIRVPLAALAVYLAQRPRNEP
jgi:excisionase family DNA binding protein